MSKDFVEAIKKKQKKLLSTKKKLKQNFVGIDNIIDRFIEHVESWYVMPEVSNRPTIVCLFGPTGVGKTDLVRQFAKNINMKNQYCEITISNNGCPISPFAESIQYLLSHSHLQPKQPSIILLDEIQNFRTINESNEEILDCKFRDVWTLLSDGKLPYSPPVDRIMNLLWNLENKNINFDERLAEGEIAQSSLITHGSGNSYHELRGFKQILQLKESVEELSTWSKSYKKSVIINALNNHSVFEEQDYTNSIIFIAGNLDDAYGFTEEVSQLDIHPDVLHEISKNIDILNIKNSLRKRFKPEQISRMGNNILIYPSLNKKAFESIIDKKVNIIKERVYNNFDVTLNVDDSVKRIIYDNGVYPTQGVRPLFSTINDVLENSLPKFITQAILSGNMEIDLYFENNYLVAPINGETVTRKYQGSISRIKAKASKNKDKKILAAVHEAGHAVVFAALFEASPLAIVVSPSDDKKGGFMQTNNVYYSKDYAQKRVCCMMAGQASEKIFFGRKNIGEGNSSDIEKATKLAAQAIRKWGMGKYSSVISNNDPELKNNEQKESSGQIECYLSECKERAESLLREHIDLLIEIIEYLKENNSLDSNHFCEICGKHGIKIKNMPFSNDAIYPNYEDKYLKFLEKNL